MIIAIAGRTARALLASFRWCFALRLLLARFLRLEVAVAVAAADVGDCAFARLELLLALLAQLGIELSLSIAQEN